CSVRAVDVFLFLYYSYCDRLGLHSFPTRRSSDLFGNRARSLRGLRAYKNWQQTIQARTIDEMWGNPRASRRPRLARALEDIVQRSEEHTSELQSRENLVCRLLLEKKKDTTKEQSP